MRKLFIAFAILLSSCSKDEPTPSIYEGLESREASTRVQNVEPFTVCGGCSTRVYPNPVNQPNAYLDVNGYWHVEWYGPNYITFIAEYSGVSDQFIINGVPTIRTTYNTDWNYTLGTAGLMTSWYRPFGNYTQGFRTAIANYTFQLAVDIQTDEVFNASGSFLRGGKVQGIPTSQSRSDNTTSLVLQHFEEMKGDTITLYYETEFAYDNEDYKQVRIDSLSYIIKNQ